MQDATNKQKDKSTTPKHNTTPRIQLQRWQHQYSAVGESSRQTSSAGTWTRQQALLCTSKNIKHKEHTFQGPSAVRYSTRYMLCHMVCRWLHVHHLQQVHHWLSLLLPCQLPGACCCRLCGAAAHARLPPWLCDRRYHQHPRGTRTSSQAPQLLQNTCNMAAAAAMDETGQDRCRTHNQQQGCLPATHDPQAGSLTLVLIWFNNHQLTLSFGARTCPHYCALPAALLPQCVLTKPQLNRPQLLLLLLHTCLSSRSPAAVPALCAACCAPQTPPDPARPMACAGAPPRAAAAPARCLSGALSQHRPASCGCHQPAQQELEEEVMRHKINPKHATGSTHMVRSSRGSGIVSA